ncbi:MAG TPA: adenylate/guanylate cyclase domain-containing protein [Chitinivibrionales bacterium]|nr:adenylate/guanylate cyclase domain-containing protein [Chitinivibrionales bacterium]
MKLLRRIGKSLLIGSAMGIAVALLFNLFFLKRVIDVLEDQTYYLRYHMLYEDNAPARADGMEEENDNGIYIIDIDEMSQHKLGKYWNWDRSYHAQMLRTLAKHDPAAVLFDIMFFDPDDKNYVSRFERLIDTCKSRTPGFTVPAPVYGPLLSSIDYDRRFIAATGQAGNVFHAVEMEEKRDYPGWAQSTIESKMTMEWHDSLHPSSALILPPLKRKQLFDKKPVIDGIFPELARAARDIGFVNMPPNSDGVVREIPLLYGFGDHTPVYLPISVRAAATLFGTPNGEIVFEPGRYLDIGRPLKAFKDSSGTLRFSYPNLTAPMVEAIIDKREAIMGCRPRATVEVASLLRVGRDKNGAAFVEMSCGLFPPSVSRALLDSGTGRMAALRKGDSLFLGPSMVVKRSSSDQWALTAPEGDGEWDLSAVDLETLGRLSRSDFDKVRPGEKRLLFYDFYVTNHDGTLASSLPIMNASVLKDLCTTGWAPIEKLAPGTRMDFGKPVRIPLTKDNRHIVTYFGPKTKTFQYKSFYEVLKDRVHGNLEGRIFLVGASVQGLFDIVPAPIDNRYPGVEVHASLLNSFLTNTFVTRLAPWQDFIILLMVAIIIGFMSFFLKPLVGAILSVAAVIGYFAVAMTIFGGSHLWIEIARPVLAILLTFTAVMAYRYITEEKDRKFLQSTFKQYLSPELIDRMYASRQLPMLGGDEHVRTAYFTDIQGFSTFSEKLGSPTRLVELLNEYLSEMTDILLKRDGMLDKYEGDAIIACFGAPMPMDDHAKQACLTALDMQRRLAELRKKWTAEGDKWPAIVHEMRMRIGINTGRIVTGNMGSKTRMNYTMMGDPVNLAARLESAAKQYGVFTMISNFTCDLVKNDFEVRQLDKITVVGKSEPVTIYELMAEKGKLSTGTAQMRDLYSKGMAHYCKQEWDKAVEVLNESEKLEPYRAFAKTTPSRELIRNCVKYRENPPGPGWEGVNRLTSK